MIEATIHLLGLLALFAACFAGIAVLVLGLPGTFVILGAGLVYGWATGFAAVTWQTLGWLLVLALAGEGLEAFSGAMGADGRRPSLRVTVGAVVGGIVGGIVGTPFLFGVGSLLGALAGAFTGAFLAVASQGGGTHLALRTGFAALRGRFVGFVLKAAIAVVMVIVLGAAAL